MEKKGLVSDRCELNRQIIADNALLRELKALVARLTAALQKPVSVIAHAMEKIRQNIIVFNYGLLFVRDRRKDTNEYVEKATLKYGEYKNIHSEIKGKLDRRKKLQKELDALSVLSFGRRKELKAKIGELTEEIRELQVDEKALMRSFYKENATEMREVAGEISKANARIAELDAQEVELSIGIRNEKEKFDGLKKQAADLDQDDLADARLALRQEMESETHDRIKRNIKGSKASIRDYWYSISDADALLGETGMAERRREQRRRKELSEFKKTRSNDRE